MSLRITAQYDLSAFDKLQSPSFKRTITTALNKTITSLRTQTRREIQQRIKLKGQVINRGLKINRAQHKKFATQTPQASLTVNHNPVPLIHYQARQTKRKGISVNVKGQRKYLPKAFIATMRSGHRGVFQRDTNKRLPIRELYSTRLTDIVNNPQLIASIAKQAQQRFKIELERAIKLLWQKHSR